MYKACNKRLFTFAAVQQTTRDELVYTVQATYYI